jgi:hypothetical protein
MQKEVGMISKYSVSTVINSVATVLETVFSSRRGMARATVSHTGPSATGW